MRLPVLQSLKLRETASTTLTIGYVSGLVSGLFYGAWSVLAKHALSGYSVPPLVFATIAFAFGSLMFAPLVVRDLPAALTKTRRSAFFFALSGLCSGSAIIALAFGLQKGDVVVVSPIVSVSPLITLLIAWVLLRQLERITLTLAFGALIVVGGVALVTVGGTL